MPLLHAGNAYRGARLKVRHTSTMPLLPAVIRYSPSRDSSMHWKDNRKFGLVLTPLSSSFLRTRYAHFPTLQYEVTNINNKTRILYFQFWFHNLRFLIWSQQFQVYNVTIFKTPNIDSTLRLTFVLGLSRQTNHSKPGLLEIWLTFVFCLVGAVKIRHSKCPNFRKLWYRCLFRWDMPTRYRIIESVFNDTEEKRDVYNTGHVVDY